MSQQKEGEHTSTAYVKWFQSIAKEDISLVGGKGANLGEMFNNKFPVPPGFVITAKAYDYFIQKADLDEKIKQLLNDIDYEDTQKLNQATKHIRNLIESAPFPKELEEMILEDYGNLDVDELALRKAGASIDLLTKSPEPVFVAVRSSATTEDLAQASFAGQQDTYLNIKGNHDLIEHVKKCFASLFTARATYYRHKKGFDHLKAKLAVVVQKMIDADKSGVMFSKDPTYNKEHVVIEAVWGLGEGIVSGTVSPDHYTVEQNAEGTLKVKDVGIATKRKAFTRNGSGGKEIVTLNPDRANMQVLSNFELVKLADFALKLEEHFKAPQDVEFAIEGESIYIVQTRPITTKKETKESEFMPTTEPVISGLGASPGIGVGKVRIIANPNDVSKIKKGDVLVTEMTNPDMVVAMQKCAAIITNEGGMTAHAAIVSREMGIPCVVGTDEGTEKLKENEYVTVDGYTGHIYKGKIVPESVQKEVKPVEETKTGIKVIVDLPSFAQRAAQAKVSSVGLTRIEGIIAQGGKHPDYYLKNNDLQSYEDLVFKGLNTIAQYFDEVWVRTSDIRSDEYANLQGAPSEEEANPMLGMHGIRYSLKHPDILKCEYKAMMRIAQSGTTIGLLHPQVISVEELKDIKTIIKEVGFSHAKLGIMIETPAAVEIINDLCKEGIDFISLGTNDLIQYTLAIDRGNESVQYLYNELHPAIKNQIKKVLTTCKKHEVETSICGQAGSNPDMIEFLVEEGIDSISVNADMAHDISVRVQKIESERMPNEDEEFEIPEDVPVFTLPQSEEDEEEKKKSEHAHKPEGAPTPVEIPEVAQEKFVEEPVQTQQEEPNTQEAKPAQTTPTEQPAPQTTQQAQTPTAPEETPAQETPAQTPAQPELAQETEATQSPTQETQESQQVQSTQNTQTNSAQATQETPQGNEQPTQTPKAQEQAQTTPEQPAQQPQTPTTPEEQPQQSTDQAPQQEVEKPQEEAQAQPEASSTEKPAQEQTADSSQTPATATQPETASSPPPAQETPEQTEAQEQPAAQATQETPKTEQPPAQEPPKPAPQITQQQPPATPEQPAQQPQETPQEQTQTQEQPSAQQPGKQNTQAQVAAPTQEAQTQTAGQEASNQPPAQAQAQEVAPTKQPTQETPVQTEAQEQTPAQQPSQQAATPQEQTPPQTTQQAQTPTAPEEQPAQEAPAKTQTQETQQSSTQPETASPTPQTQEAPQTQTPQEQTQAQETPEKTEAQDQPQETKTTEPKKEEKSSQENEEEIQKRKEIEEEILDIF